MKKNHRELIKFQYFSVFFKLKEMLEILQHSALAGSQVEIKQDCWTSGILENLRTICISNNLTSGSSH